MVVSVETALGGRLTAAVHVPQVCLVAQVAGRPVVGRPHRPHVWPAPEGVSAPSVQSCRSVLPSQRRVHFAVNTATYTHIIFGE